MRTLHFVSDHLAYRGGGEIMLARVARLAREMQEIRLGILWGRPLDVLTAEERSLFSEIRTFGFPVNLNLRAVLSHVYARHRLRTWFLLHPPHTVVSFGLRSAVRVAGFSKDIRFRHVWMCQQSFPLFEPPAESIKEFVGLRILKSSKTEIVCIAQEAVDKFTHQGFPRERLHLIRNGIDVLQFQNLKRQPLSLPETEAAKLLGVDLTAVCVARIDPIKQHNVLLHAIAIARTMGTEVAALMVGSQSIGEDDYGSNLRKLANDLGIADRVVWAGHQDDVRPWLATADVAVLPSKKEAAGLALAEAGAAGLPLIGSNVGGIPELVRDGVTGFTFHPERPEELAQKLVLLARDTKLRSELGRNAQELAQSMFDSRKLDDQWKKILRKNETA